MAISEDDHNLLENFHNELSSLTMGECMKCCEKWFDMDINDHGMCRRCRNSKKPEFFSELNHMNPGPSIQELARTHGMRVPEPLSQVEEMMISPVGSVYSVFANNLKVHVMMQAWLVKGGQSKYSGHCCSFINDINKIVQKVPTLPEDLDIAIVRAKNTNNADQPLLASNDSFHVKRERLTDNLRVLKRFHPWFRVPGRIDWNSLNSLPEDGTVFHRLQSIEQTEAESASSNQLRGPNDLNEENDPTLNVTSNGFVPSFHSNQSEISELQNGLQLMEAVLTMPTIQSEPINEHDANRQYIIDAFPGLFPTGRADFHEDWQDKVSTQDYFKHLMRYHDG